MNKPIPLSALCGALLACGLQVFSAHAESASTPYLEEKSFTQSVKDGYHSLKNNMTQAFGGYTGDTEADSKTYMDHYRSDLEDYHDAMREARDDYRKARLVDQKSYLEHHRTLPMNEDIESDVRGQDGQ